MENNYVKLSTGIINKRKPVYVRFEEQLSQLVDSCNQENKYNSKPAEHLKILDSDSDSEKEIR
ncbi:hypothetical protein BpHYR1_008764 [Brachionus plicatilis]|uniref:Uncharacterized protein n=1 Tax=Brachionus plicatilis TaxID=10195 RepID=A0A3M7QDY3_BRAPC|nr:hypothetical protein BpHYR1_008764 [Brachionus plicatilis]